MTTHPHTQPSPRTASSTPDARPNPTLGRRSLLQASAAGLLTGPVMADQAAAAPASGPSQSGHGRPGHGRPSTVLRFAVVTDTHLNAEISSRLTTMKRVYDYLLGEDPDLVLNCGDITDYGWDDEFAAYRATIPAALASRLHHVPGNHEWRWDPTVLELYTKLFGSPDSAFSCRGIRFVGLAPYQILEEPSLVGAERLAWLRRALRRSPDRRGRDPHSEPAIVFQHMPIGGANYYTNDAEDLVEVLEDHNVRALFAGHTHSQAVDQFNGMTQYTGNATRDGGWLFWCEVVQRGSGLVLTVEARTLDAAIGAVTSTKLPELALTGERAGLDLAPRSVSVRPAAVPPAQPGAPVPASSVSISVQLDRRNPATSIVAQVYPQWAYGERQAPQLVALAKGADGRWTGTLPFQFPVPGEHRVQVRVSNAGANYDHVEHFWIAGGEAKLVDEQRLGGQVQAGTMQVGEVIVAASTSGRATAMRVRRGRLRTLWSREIGPVARQGAAIGNTLYLPTVDHRLVALDVHTGRVQWRVDLGAPALSKVTVATVDGRPSLFLTAGTKTFRVDPARGRVLWRADHHSLSAGQVGADDQRVYVPSGDGHAYAFDVRTGKQLWRIDIASNRTDRYGRMLYAAWGYTVLMPTPGTVLFGTVGKTLSVDRATGTKVWELGGNRHYCPGLVTDRGLLLCSEYWGIDLVDPATGSSKWQTKNLNPQRFFESGPVQDRDDVFVYGVTGRLLHVDLATGVRTELLQPTVANTFSTPVLVHEGGMRYLVNGFQDGVVRLVRLG